MDKGIKIRILPPALNLESVFLPPIYQVHAYYKVLGNYRLRYRYSTYSAYPTTSISQSIHKTTIFFQRTRFPAPIHFLPPPPRTNIPPPPMISPPPPYPVLSPFPTLLSTGKSSALTQSGGLVCP